MDTRMLYLHALSAIHSGTGQSADVIDLPVAREKVTRWPFLPGSSIKGVLRDACASGPHASPTVFEEAFGPDTENASKHAGALWFTDGHLLCLSVRSLRGTFAWVSCPLALSRWVRDHRGGNLAVPATLSTAPAEDEILLPAGSSLVNASTVYLEDLSLKARSEAPGAAELVTLARTIADAALDDQAWREAFGSRFGVVHDETFTFLTETATEVVARIKLQDGSKTVQRGGLWYEEAVPAESIFACPVFAVPFKKGQTAQELFDVLRPVSDAVVQIGGSASVGRGLVQARVVS